MNSSTCESTQGSSGTDSLSALQTPEFWELGTRSDITNTHTLIQAFNNATDEKERRFLKIWIFAYGMWLDNRELIEDSDVSILTQFFDLNCQNAGSREIVKGLFDGLCRRVAGEVLRFRNLMRVLDYALSKLDASFSEDLSEILLSLVDLLLSKLDGKSSTRETYESYGTMLFALYQTVELLNKVSPNSLTNSKYKKVKTRLKEIESSQEYYPIEYQAKLIRIAIKKLASGNTSFTIVSAGRRAFYAAIGGLYFVQAISALAHLNLDIDALKSSVKNMRKTIPDAFGRWSMKYLENRLTLIFQAAEITMSTNDFTHFKECYDETMKRLGTAILKYSTWTMLRYCMVTQLRLIALDGSSYEVRKCAIEELISWGNKCSNAKWSTENRHVFQALLESLYSIFQRKNSDQLRRVLTTMATTENRRFRTIVNEWLGSNTLEDKLQEEPSTQIEEVDRLYFKVRSKLELLLTHEDVQSNIEDMKATYRNSSFAEAFF